MTGLSGPSPHLSWAELACHDAARTPYPEQWRSSRAIWLGAAFELIRYYAGAPLAVSSAYRTPEHNASIPGSAPNSLHVQGLALDIRPPKGRRVEWLFDVVRAVAGQADSRIKGIGLYAEARRPFVHFDLRDSAHLVVFKGSARRQAPDVARRKA